jgi:hypothetical protein
MISRKEARLQSLKKHSVYHWIVNKIDEAIKAGEFEIAITNEQGRFDCFVDSNNTLSNVASAIFNKFNDEGYLINFDKCNKFLNVGWW